MTLDFLNTNKNPILLKLVLRVPMRIVGGWPFRRLVNYLLSFMDAFSKTYFSAGVHLMVVDSPIGEGNIECSLSKSFNSSSDICMYVKK